MSVVLAAGLLTAFIGVILAVLIGLALRFFPSGTDPRIEEVAGILPGANCGGCGFAGCADMAKNIVEKGTSPALCCAANEEILRKIAEITGTGTVAAEKHVAVVLCSGGLSTSARSAFYNGVSDCRTAAAVQNGGKQCRFGCMGLGSCTRACKFGAIEVIDGLAVVHPELCRGCGACVSVCPHKLIKLVPASAKIHVYCNSLTAPALRRKICRSACINCLKCVKKVPEQIRVQQGLVRVNYQNPPDESVLDVHCPMGTLGGCEEHLHLLRERAEKGSSASRKGEKS